MSTSLHAVFHLIFGNVYFVIVVSYICRQKLRFSENSQNSISEKSIFGHFEVIFFQRISFSLGGGGIFLLAR